MIVTDNSGTPITDNQGLIIESFDRGIAQIFTDEFETFLASTRENRPDTMTAVFNLVNEFALRQIEPNLIRFFPILNKSAEAAVVEYHGETSLSVVGADIDHETNGLAGSGSSYYTTGINFSSVISDINNFSAGIYSQTDSSNGICLGATDSTNYVTIESDNAGSMRVKVGTVEVVDSASTGEGHTILNVQGGTLKGWRSKDKSLEEFGTSQSIAGSLPNIEAYLGALNNNGTPANYTSKRYSCLWVYDGELDDSGVMFIDTLVENFMKETGNSVNYGA